MQDNQTKSSQDIYGKAEILIKELGLSYFRSYEALTLSCAAKFIVLNGQNGAGKTNILEAISLFGGGRGLRGAQLKNLGHVNHSDKNWGVRIHLQNGPLETMLVTTVKKEPFDNPDTPYKEKKILRIDGDLQRSQSILNDYLSVLWLTPQMERLFLDGSSERRRFFDRFVFTFDSAHAGRIARYENAMRERSRLLKDGRGDDHWLGALEKNMAETAIAITAARQELCKKINLVLTRHQAFKRDFPRLKIALSDELAHMLAQTNALKTEQYFLKNLRENRAFDAQYGGSKQGPHKCDFDVTHLDKNMPAPSCSTGEQKTMLISLILAQSSLIEEQRGLAPILLLDDIVSHLDDKRRASLFHYLDALSSQCWFTSTSADDFRALSKKALFYRLENSQIITKKDPRS